MNVLFRSIQSSSFQSQDCQDVSKPPIVEKLHEEEEEGFITDILFFNYFIIKSFQQVQIYQHLLSYILLK